MLCSKCCLTFIPYLYQTAEDRDRPETVQISHVQAGNSISNNHRNTIMCQRLSQWEFWIFSSYGTHLRREKLRLAQWELMRLSFPSHFQVAENHHGPWARLLGPHVTTVFVFSWTFQSNSVSSHFSQKTFPPKFRSRWKFWNPRPGGPHK